jgi:hypothetical protein
MRRTKRMRLFCELYRISFLFAVLSFYQLPKRTFGHSGLHLVKSIPGDETYPEFSAAYLASVQRFVKSEKVMRGSVYPGMENVTLEFLRNPCENCHSLRTFDYLDFMLEHLSSTTNQLPIYHDHDLFQMLAYKLSNTSLALKKQSSLHHLDPRLDNTLAILIFSSNAYSRAGKLQSTIRSAFLEVTFWSMHRYFRNIHIFVANQRDEQTMKSLGMPYASLKIIETALDHRNLTVWLPRDSLLYLVRKLKKPSSFFQKYKYIYFSEGDQILHLRGPEVLYNAIDDSNGSFVMIPHRLQVSVSSILKKRFDGGFFPSFFSSKSLLQ